MFQATPTELKGKRYDIFSASNMSFPYHIHRTYEIMRVVKGSARSVIAGVERIVPAGESVVVFPLQYHSFSADASSQILAYIFAPEFIPEFVVMMRDKLPADPLSFTYRRNTSAMQDNIWPVITPLTFYICIVGIVHCRNKTIGNYIPIFFNNGSTFSQIRADIRFRWIFILPLWNPVCTEVRLGIGYDFHDLLQIFFF